MHEIDILLQDDFARVRTKVKTDLSVSELMDAILEIGDVE